MCRGYTTPGWQQNVEAFLRAASDTEDQENPVGTFTASVAPVLEPNRQATDFVPGIATNWWMLSELDHGPSVVVRYHASVCPVSQVWNTQVEVGDKIRISLVSATMAIVAACALYWWG
jgi:hypothetical protein